ncbi:AHH domain-containing protein [Marinimicrobium agarilyticum]|uniref:AHH domain-containing protein n=1 Tax=Marinimicrobium agarilyticum TaxID=306546 RepID=UPI0003F68EF8|nr:AHH domain-containing protein [Marinimicrobium agarilyticum]
METDRILSMEYREGYRITPLRHEMSPLEAAIAQFEVEAKAYHAKVAGPVPESPKARQKRESELNSALKHLKNERLKVACLAQIQARLAEYQGWGRQQAEKDPVALMDEPHHPTTVLARNMRADGRPQPSRRHSPHHIVAGKGRHPNTVRARLNIHLAGVRINDPGNGTWMPRTKADRGHWSMPNAPAHSEIHTYNYETWVNTLVDPQIDEHAVRAVLTRLRVLLRDGQQPRQVTAPKDVHWRPTL